MAYNKYNKKPWNGGYRKETPTYKEKRGSLKPLMTEDQKSNSRVEELAYDFACRIVRLYQYGTGTRELENEGNRESLSPLIPKSHYPSLVPLIPKPLILQVLRSGTSIAANLNEAKHPQSDADYLSKASIALKEARETEFWLNLLHDNGYLDENQFCSLNHDLDRILRILVTVTTKVRERLRAEHEK